MPTPATGPVYESYQYDANGSLTQISGNRNLSLSWDANNRASAISGRTYRYDPSDYRIGKGGTGATLNYYLDGEHLDAVYDGGITVQSQHLRGSIIDEVVYSYQRDNTNKLVAATSHHDALQSVLGESSHQGSIQYRQSYTAFGTATNPSQPQRYTGREMDSESGLYYYRARYYDPVIGRFISEDPLGFQAGVNFYAYCLNNPVNCNDPSGNIPLPLVTGLIGGAAGGLGNAVGQIVANQGFNNFSFRDVGIASGVGFVAGVAAPFTATTVLGAALTGSAANVAQFGITQTVKGENITVSGALINAATGLAGGVIGGPVGRATGLRFAENSPFINSAFARQLNNNLDIKLNTGGGALARNFFGAIFSSLDPSPLFNTNQSAAGGFLLYPNKSNTNTVQEVYTK